jgi:hypothetical protein
MFLSIFEVLVIIRQENDLSDHLGLEYFVHFNVLVDPSAQVSRQFKLQPQLRHPPVAREEFDLRRKLIHFSRVELNRCRCRWLRVAVGVLAAARTHPRQTFGVTRSSIRTSIGLLRNASTLRVRAKVCVMLVLLSLVSVLELLMLMFCGGYTNK